MENNNLGVTRNRGITAPSAIALACAIAMQHGAWAQTASVNDVIQSDTMRAVTTQSMLAQAAYALASETSDTDADNVPEPLAMAAGTGPIGGGVIPATSGAPKTDGFGRALGYCAFDIGATNTSTNRISGAASPSPTSVVFAVVSASIDGVFSSNCATLGSGGTAAGDDLVVTYNLLQVRMGMGGSMQWGSSVANLTELNWLAANAAAQLRDGEVRLRRDTSQIYRWNTATSAWSLVNASPWASSGTTLTYSGGDVQVTRLQSLPNATWGHSLYVGGDGRNGLIGSTEASVATTNGNLHLDAGKNFSTYLNWYDGNAVYIGRGNSTTRALVDANGMTLYDGGFNVGSTKLTDNSLAFGQGGGWYMSDATWIRATNDKSVYTGGDINAGGRLVAGAGQAYSWITMSDSDEGARYVHNNSGTIGFVGNHGSWIMRVADDGNIWSSYYGDWLSNVIARRNSTNDFTSQNYFYSNRGNGSYLGYNNNPGLQAYSNDGGAAFMSFHRGGYYAVNIGLDPDNVFRIGGWSAGGSRLSLDMSGNLAVAGNISAPGTVTAARFESPGLNIAIGTNALPIVTTGSANVGVGVNALLNNTSGNSNTAVGVATLYSNSIGGANAATGWGSLRSNTTGSANSGFGFGSVGGVTTGGQNTGVGYYAGTYITTGQYNTAAGSYSMQNITSGSYNTAIGAYTWLTDGLQYATAIGAGSSVSTSNTIALGRASDSVVVGGSSANPSYKFYVNGAAGGTTGWNTYSDGRLKRNVEVVAADPLAVIMKLKPVRYEFRHEEFPGMNFAHGQQIGFIAQDLEQVVPEVVKTGADGYKMVEYAPLTALLTAGVQELQTNNVAMQQRVSNLESQNNEQSQLIQALQQQLMIEQSARLH